MTVGKMTATPDDIPVRFSTDELPDRDRLAATREIHGRLTARLDIEPVPGVPLHYRVVARKLPGLIVASGSRSSMTVRRTHELLADGNDDVALMMSSTAGHMVSQFGRELVTGAGEAILFSAADLGSARTVSVQHCLNIALRRRVLATMVVGLEDRFMRPIARDNEALHLLTSYARLLEDQQSPTTPELRHLVVSHVYDLVALSLGATRDAAAIANGRGVRAARLHAIKTQILNGLNRQELSLAGLAARNGVTRRYVQMLFEREGTTFSRFLLDHRLARAHRMLSDPRHYDLSISAIAFDVGFGDLSHFNRAFRRRYSQAPSAVRASARRET
jgi:AraC-like DNA-binding protein